MRDNYLRIVDESGEDYLYPAQQFAIVELSTEVEDAFLSHYSEAA